MAIDSHVGETGVYSALDLIPQTSNPDSGATSGNGTLYVKTSDGKLYYKNVAGTEAALETKGAVDLTADVTGVLPVANGGSGAATAAANAALMGPASGAAAAPSFRTLGAGDLKLACFHVIAGASGKNGAGAITATGVKVGDKIIMASYTGVTPPTTSALSAIEATVTVNDQIQQSDAANLSAGHFDILVLALS